MFGVSSAERKHSECWRCVGWIGQTKEQKMEENGKCEAPFKKWVVLRALERAILFGDSSHLQRNSIFYGLPPQELIHTICTYKVKKLVEIPNRYFPVGIGRYFSVFRL